MRLNVHLKGVDTLSLRTKALIEAARTGLRFGTAEAAQILIEEAKTLVPVDTGHLRDSIHAELVEQDDLHSIVAVKPAYEEPNPYGFDPAYARRIEYGFVGPDALGRVYHQAAQAYMRPAWDGKKDEAREAIAEGIYTQLESAHK